MRNSFVCCGWVGISRHCMIHWWFCGFRSHVIWEILAAAHGHFTVNIRRSTSWLFQFCFTMASWGRWKEPTWYVACPSPDDIMTFIQNEVMYNKDLSWHGSHLKGGKPCSQTSRPCSFLSALLFPFINSGFKDEEELWTAAPPQCRQSGKLRSFLPSS